MWCSCRELLFLLVVSLTLAAKEYENEKLDEDPVAADEYVERLIAQEKDQRLTDEELLLDDANRSSYVWTKKKPDELDHTATLLLLSLRERYRKYFDDKKSVKSQLWKKIAHEMEEAGFKLGENGAERCRQKFSNLSKQYTNYVKHMSTTGTEHRDPPPYYTEMHDLLGVKDVIAPTNLQDSQNIQAAPNDDRNESTSTLYSNSLDDSSSSAELIKNRFAAVNKTIRPPSVNLQMMTLLSKHHDEDTAMKNKLFDLIAAQNAQRDKMLELMAQLVENTKKN